MTPPVASVIVCTRNRAELLEACLDDIISASPPWPWELVIVDNASTDNTPQVVDRVALTSSARVVTAFEARPGLSAARNRGVAIASGEFLLFTDDDALVQPGWIAALVSAFAEADVVAVGGRIIPEWTTPPPPWLEGRHVDVVALVDRGAITREFTPGEYPVGANMAIRASALRGMREPFDLRLGHVGSINIAFEEFELCHRLSAQGRLLYQADAVVRHRVQRERLSWWGLRRACFQNGFGMSRAGRLLGTRPPSLFRSAAMTVRSLLTVLVASRRNRRRPGTGSDAAEREFLAYWWLGRNLEMAVGRTPEISNRVLRWTSAVMRDRRSDVAAVR